MTRTQPEARIVNAILRRLNAAPQTFARKTHGSRYSVGWPDIVGCTNGRMFAIEVKQPSKRATPRQVHELAKWAAAGALVGTATTVDEAVDIAWPMMTLAAPLTTDRYMRPGTRIEGGAIVESWVETWSGNPNDPWIRQDVVHDMADLRKGWSIG